MLLGFRDALERTLGDGKDSTTAEPRTEPLWNVNISRAFSAQRVGGDANAQHGGVVLVRCALRREWVG
jgi:hypothetical protein